VRRPAPLLDEGSCEVGWVGGWGGVGVGVGLEGLRVEGLGWVEGLRGWGAGKEADGWT